MILWLFSVWKRKENNLLGHIYTAQVLCMVVHIIYLIYEVDTRGNNEEIAFLAVLNSWINMWSVPKWVGTITVLWHVYHCTKHKHELTYCSWVFVLTNPSVIYCTSTNTSIHTKLNKGSSVMTSAYCLTDNTVVQKAQ